jgi:hypothetical protein
MRADDFIEDVPSHAFGVPSVSARFRVELARALRSGPVAEAPDVEIAVALTRLVHDELELYGTSGSQMLSEDDMREALRALHAVLGRIGIDVDVPFRDFSTFRTYWGRNDGYGSWQARRDMLEAIFGPLHDQLADLEVTSLTSSLADPVSPRGRTGWSKVDEEIAELRRHFQTAQTPQDYRNVGNDCVFVTEALSRLVYDPERHLRPGEEEPPVSNTKQRLDRFVEDGLSGSENAELRKLVRAAIELAQAVKHRDNSTRRTAGMSADAVILLANLLRRVEEQN